MKKLSPEKWELVVGTFIQLFSTTTARQLFDETLRAETTLPEDGGEAAAQGRYLPRLAMYSQLTRPLSL